MPERIIANAVFIQYTNMLGLPVVNDVSFHSFGIEPLPLERSPHDLLGGGQVLEAQWSELGYMAQVVCLLPLLCVFRVESASNTW